MNKLITGILVAVVLFAIIYYGGSAAVEFVAQAFPPSAADWLPLIKIIAWVVYILLFGGLCTWVAVLIGGLIGIVIQGWWESLNIKRKDKK
jgi:hypothetical protein